MTLSSRGAYLYCHAHQLCFTSHSTNLSVKFQTLTQKVTGCSITNTFQETNLIRRHVRIIFLTRSKLHQDLKRSMSNHDTLGLENLGLDKTAAPQNASRTRKRKGRRAKDQAFLQSELQQAAGQPISSVSSSAPSMLLSHQPLPIATLGASTNTLNHWPLRDHNNRITHAPPHFPQCLSVQASVSPPDSPKASKYYHSCTLIGPKATAVPLVQPKLSSRRSGSTVQNSGLSVRYIVISHPRVDEQYRSEFRKAASEPNRLSHSLKIRDLDITPTTPPSRKRLPSVTDSKQYLIHLPAPIPTATYLDDAHAIFNLLASPQRLLLVLDLNGTLLYRPRASQNYTPRPCLPRFLQYAFANHSLLVWSSALPYNVKGICTRLFSRDQREMLLGEWGRNTLGLTCTQYKERVQVYKRLDRIWRNEDLQRLHPDFTGGRRWGQNNTVLIDDSALKASAQPFNHVKVPEFVPGGGEKEGGGRDVLGQVVGYLEEARKWNNVSGFVRHRPFLIDEGWRWPAEEGTTRRT